MVYGNERAHGALVSAHSRAAAFFYGSDMGNANLGRKCLL